MRDRQRSCLAFIESYQRETGGVSPSLREIGAALDYKSMGGVVMLLDELEARGKIRRWHNGRRRIQVLEPSAIYHEGNAEFFVWDDQAKALRPR